MDQSQIWYWNRTVWPTSADTLAYFYKLSGPLQLVAYFYRILSNIIIFWPVGGGWLQLVQEGFLPHLGPVPHPRAGACCRPPLGRHLGYGHTSGGSRHHAHSAQAHLGLHYWANGEVCLYLQTNWSHFSEKLRGKLWIFFWTSISI